MTSGPIVERLDRPAGAVDGSLVFAFSAFLRLVLELFLFFRVGDLLLSCLRQRLCLLVLVRCRLLPFLLLFF